MLFMHETHTVIGRHFADFEAVYRDEWLDLLAKTDNARLAWYLNHAMGSGPAYQVVTITAVTDGAAWEGLAQRMLDGDLSSLMAKLDGYRYQVEGKLVAPVYWSALQNLDLASLPTDGREHELSIFMHDTGWPDATLDDYIELWDKDYWVHMRQIPPERTLLDIQACWQVAHGSGIRPEAILMQKIMNFDSLGRLFTSVEEFHDPTRWPDSYMIKGLELRDQWESKLLRTSKWSPLW
jgi:hypothetical protein